MMLMPVLHWLAITFVLGLSITEHGINSQTVRGYETDAATRFIVLHGLRALELARGDGL
jgi:hypothetical protein